jgi:general secretion pathway protein E/type IV pilus assembly protein PilB
MVESGMLSAMDAETLRHLCAAGAVQAGTEGEILSWLASEYGLDFTTLESIEPDRELLARIPARILLKENLLPLRQIKGVA